MNSGILKSDKYINLTVLKVKSVEIHPLYQVTQRLRLKRSQSRVTDLTEEERAGHDNEVCQLYGMHLNTNHAHKRRLTRMPQSLHC